MHAVYRTRSFNAVFTGICHPLPFWGRWTQTTSAHHVTNHMISPNCIIQDHGKTLSLYPAAVSQKYSVAIFATLWFLSCLHSPEPRCSCCRYFYFSVTLKHAVWCSLCFLFSCSCLFFFYLPNSEFEIRVQKQWMKKHLLSEAIINKKCMR